MRNRWLGLWIAASLATAWSGIGADAQTLGPVWGDTPPGYVANPAARPVSGPGSYQPTPLFAGRAGNNPQTPYLPRPGIPPGWNAIQTPVAAYGPSHTPTTMAGFPTPHVSTVSSPNARPMDNRFMPPPLLKNQAHYPGANQEMVAQAFQPMPLLGNQARYPGANPAGPILPVQWANTDPNLGVFRADGIPWQETNDGNPSALTFVQQAQPGAPPPPADAPEPIPNVPGAPNVTPGTPTMVYASTAAPAEPYTFRVPVQGVYAHLEGAWLKRGTTSFISLGQQLDLTSSPGTPIVRNELSTKSIHFDLEPGMRVLLGAAINENSAVELTYMGLHLWSAEARVVNGAHPNFANPADRLSSPFFHVRSEASAGLSNGLGATGRGIVYSFAYRSFFSGGEAHYRWRIDDYPWLTALAGMRILSVAENAALRGFEPGNPAANEDDVETTTAETANLLTGFQVGATINALEWDNLSLLSEIKGALYVNSASQRLRNQVFVADTLTPPAPTPLNILETRAALASTIEWSIQGRWEVATNVVLRAGYQCLYVAGLALAPNQFNNIGSDIANGVNKVGRGKALHHDGDLFLHGPTAGVEIYWGGTRPTYLRP